MVSSLSEKRKKKIPSTLSQLTQSLESGKVYIVPTLHRFGAHSQLFWKRQWHSFEEATAPLVTKMKIKWKTLSSCYYTDITGRKVTICCMYFWSLGEKFNKRVRHIKQTNVSAYMTVMYTIKLPKPSNKKNTVIKGTHPVSHWSDIYSILKVLIKLLWWRLISYMGLYWKYT